MTAHQLSLGPLYLSKPELIQMIWTNGYPEVAERLYSVLERHFPFVLGLEAKVEREVETYIAESMSDDPAYKALLH